MIINSHKGTINIPIKGIEDGRYQIRWARSSDIGPRRQDGFIFDDFIRISPKGGDEKNPPFDGTKEEKFPLRFECADDGNLFMTIPERYNLKRFEIEVAVYLIEQVQIAAKSILKNSTFS